MDLAVARAPLAPPGAPLYESHYVTAAAPGGGRALWLRYTAHKERGEPPRGSLWCTLFAAGLGDTPEDERPLEATLWGEPPLGRASAHLADGTTIAWRRGVWSVDRPRDVRFGER